MKRTVLRQEIMETWQRKSAARPSETARGPEMRLSQRRMMKLSWRPVGSPSPRCEKNTSR